MKILILQLSDIHFWAEKENPLSGSSRVNEIVNAVQSIEAGIDACFLAFTGDVAQSAAPAEYEIGHNFFDVF